MKTTARIRKRLILLIAFSIVWVFIGSLVIFHQEQVLGKSFNWNKISFIVPKSKEDKSVAKIVPDNSNGHDQPNILAILDETLREQLLAGHFSLLKTGDDERIAFVCIIASPGLRAPPLA